MKANANELWNRFDMAHVKQIRYAQTAPRLHTIKSRTNWPQPDLICEFVLGDWGAIPAWGVFSDWGPSPYVFAMTDACDESAKVAEAIAIAQGYHFFPPCIAPTDFDCQGLFQDIASIPVHVIAAYQAAPTLRSNYPWLHSFLTQQTPNGGYVYLLDDQQGHFKIGRSVDVNSRITQLRTQPPFNIEIVATAWVPDCKSEEKRLHKQYGEQRLKGEWFALFPEQVADLTAYLNYIFDMGDKMASTYRDHDFSDWREVAERSCLWYVSVEESRMKDEEFWASLGREEKKESEVTA